MRLLKPISKRLGAWIYLLRGKFGRWWAVTPTWKAVGVVALVLGVLGGGVWLAGSPAYGAFRKWMVERNGREAVVAAAGGDWERARDLSLSVVLTGDRRIEVLRVLVESMRHLDDRRLSSLSDALMTHPECTAEDRLGVFRSMALIEPLGRLRMRWQMLPEVDRKEVSFKLALVDRFIQDGDFTLALDFLKEYRSESPAPEIALRVIRALIGQGTVRSLGLAQTGVVEEWKKHPEGGVDWLDPLEELPLEAIDVFALGPMRKWLKGGRPGQPGRGELMEARIQYQGTAEDARGKVVEDAVAAWRQAAPRELCRFLFAVGQSGKLAEVFDDAAVTGDADLVKARLDALIAIGNNEALEASLALHEKTLRPVEQFAYRALAAARAERASDRNLAWNKVIAEGLTSAKADDLLAMHGFARRHGMVDEAERALLEAVKDGRGPLPSYRALMRQLGSLEEKGQEHDLMTILTAYLKLEPWNPTLVGRHTYLSVMLGLEPAADGVALVGELVGRAKEGDVDDHLLAVWATLQLLAGQAGEAGGTWKKLTLAVDDLAPGFRAANLLSRVVVGELDPGDPLIKGIAWDTMLPCERESLNKVLRNYLDGVGGI